MAEHGMTRMQTHQAHINHVVARGHAALESLEKLKSGQSVAADVLDLEFFEGDLDAFEQIVGSFPKDKAAIEAGRSTLRSLPPGMFGKGQPPSLQPPGGQPPTTGGQTNLGGEQEQLAQLAEAIERDPEGTARKLAQKGVRPRDVFGEAEKQFGGGPQTAIRGIVSDDTELRGGSEAILGGSQVAELGKLAAYRSPDQLTQSPRPPPPPSLEEVPNVESNAPATTSDLAKILAGLEIPGAPVAPVPPAGTAPLPRAGGTIDPRLLEQIRALLQPVAAPQISPLGALITGGR
jgi:hypothetical protein